MVCAVYPTHKHLSAKVRRLIEFFDSPFRPARGVLVKGPNRESSVEPPPQMGRKAWLITLLTGLIRYDRIER